MTKTKPVLRISIIHDGKVMDLLLIPLRTVEMMVSVTGKTFTVEQK